MEQSSDKKGVLTDRQLKTIPCLVAAKSWEEGRRRAKVSKATLWGWLKDPSFKEELDRQRNLVIKEALDVLKAAMTRAAETLVGLLDEEDARLKRFVAVDILNLTLRIKETIELEERIAALERLR